MTRNEQEQYLRNAPEQFKLLYTLWGMCSDALCYRTEQTYQQIGHPLPHGSCLFEVQLYLLAYMVDLLDSFDHDEDTITRFIQFACPAIAFDLHPRLLANSDLHQIALSRLIEYWELRSSSNNWGELEVTRLKRVQNHLDAAHMTPKAIQGEHPLTMSGSGFFDHFNILTDLVANATHVGSTLGHFLKQVLETSIDVTSLDVEEMERLIGEAASDSLIQTRCTP